MAETTLDHEPTGWNGTHQVCSECGRDVCDEPAFQPRNEPYESDENLTCIECTAELEGLDVLDVVRHLQAVSDR